MFSDILFCLFKQFLTVWVFFCPINTRPNETDQDSFNNTKIELHKTCGNFKKKPSSSRNRFLVDSWQSSEFGGKKRKTPMTHNPYWRSSQQKSRSESLCQNSECSKNVTAAFSISCLVKAHEKSSSSSQNYDSVPSLVITHSSDIHLNIASHSLPNRGPVIHNPVKNLPHLVKDGTVSHP